MSTDDEKSKSFATGEYIYKLGDPGGSLYYIQEGAVDLLQTIQGKEKVVGKKSEGQLLGSFSYILDQSMTSDAKVTRKVNLVIFNRESRDKLLETVPRWFKMLVHDLISNIKKTHKNLVKIKAQYDKMITHTDILEQEVQELKDEIARAKNDPHGIHKAS